jgi:hypothetical protein
MPVAKSSKDVFGVGTYTNAGQHFEQQGLGLLE